MELAMPTDAAGTAHALLEIWDRLSRQHVALAAGCGCGVGGVTLQLQDFEQDIVDYLLGQAERGRNADVIAFLHRYGVDAAGNWHIGNLLAALADASADVYAASDVAEFLLSRLGKTLRSFAKLHG